MHGAPAKHLLAREAAAFAKMRFMATFGSAVKLPVRGDGHMVMVIPGFMASDRTTGRIRRSLDRAGYQTCGWGLGRNRGVKADIFERLDARFAALNLTYPITLVGWSLGGLVAREYAKHAPQNVTQVITLGSPFSGDPRANNAWRVYEKIAGHRIDNLPLPLVLNEKPPVPTTAFWSARDGVVAPFAARGLPDETDQAIELDCSHMGFVAQAHAIRQITKVIAG
jgi:alpha-beta hydrolase superfamily lysophospholipase